MHHQTDRKQPFWRSKSFHHIALLLTLIGFAFLAIMGKSAGGFMWDMTAFAKDLACLREDAQEIIDELETPFSLKEYDYPFAHYGGYHFLYFNANDGDDPPVYNFEEGRAESTKVSGSFSAFMDKVADQYRHKF